MICLEVNKGSELFQSRILSVHAAGGVQALGTCVDLGPVYMEVGATRLSM